MTPDPGIALGTTGLGEALEWLSPSLRVRITPVAGREEADAIEEAALAAGMRSRRVLLDAEWWKSPGLPMLARIADRRQAPRPALDGRPADSLGWVALVPRLMGGYRMLASPASGEGPLEWDVDGALAARLAPFAYTFHRSFKREPLTVRDLLALATAPDKRELGLVVLIALASALLGLLTPMATSRLIDAAIPAGATGAVGNIVAGLAAAGLALVALDMLRAIALLRFEGRMGIGVEAAVLDRVISAPSRFFRSFTSSDLAQRLGSVHMVQRALANALVSVVVAVPFVAANLMLMFVYSATLAFAALGVAACVVALSIATGIVQVGLGRRIEALDGKLSSLSYEYLCAVGKLRVAAAEPRAFERWAATYDERRILSRKSADLANLETVAMTFLQPAATVLVLFLAWKVASSATGSSARGALSTGAFVAFHTALFALLGGLQALVATAIGLLHLKPVWERARPILETLPEKGAATGKRHEPSGAIELRGLSFAYPEGPPVLHGVDLDVRAGEFVAIVGPSGSGKSTLIRLLLGFETPQSGAVRYDGCDLADLDLAYLRRRIGTVLQGGKLWEGDLYGNIVGAAHLPVEAAWEAARAAGLAADIEAMPMGMYTMVGEGISTLSGGQRQRVMIARALVGSPAILLLDEATSALDNIAQAKVLEGLAQTKATRLVIAHRLTTVCEADRVVVLDRGRVVQEGNFAELAAAPGLFAELLARQSA